MGGNEVKQGTGEEDLTLGTLRATIENRTKITVTPIPYWPIPIRVE